ncbi:MAG: SIR2 family NAD-dependent protein deacylase [Egibacteraceae bacterium]
MVPDKGHYRLQARSIRNGLVVPFLGAGVNLCDRPTDQTFRQGGECLPSGAELADYLAREFYYEQDDHPDLLRISQYVSLKIGVPELYFALHKVFDGDYLPSKVHRFLATMPPGEGERGEPVYPLILTTNYDDALETAFDEIGRPYDLVYYVADADDGTRGKFVHVPPDGRPVPIEVPNEYLDVGSDQRAVIVKVHGMVNRDDQQRDSYVITEDHYIDYLAQTDINRLLPAKLVARLRHQRTQLLFLGYGLRDWNLRVILHRIWGSRELRNNSVAIQRETDDIEAGCWAKRGVQIFDLPLDEYIGELDAALDAHAALAKAALLAAS